MTKLLVVLDEIETADAVLAATELLAARVPDATIIGLHVHPDVDPYFLPTEEIMTPARKAEFQAKTAKRSADLHKHFEQWRSAFKKPDTANWNDHPGTEAEVVTREAANADFTVISQAIHHRAEGGPSAVTAAIFKARAAVVIVPKIKSETLGNHVAIAWKDSEQARNAIRAALPLLHKAYQVTILVGAEHGGEAPPPVEISHSTTAGGTGAALHHFSLEGQSIGEALLREAKKIGADLLVMGAYSHPRIEEFLLGGASREVLQNTKIPILMHH